MRRALPPALLLVAAIGAWQVYVDAGLIERLILPAPSEIARSFVDDADILFPDLVATGSELVLGLLVALVVGVALALAMHFSAVLRRTLYPLCIGTQALPIPILAPLLIVWLGFGLAPKLAVVALVCFFPIVVTTMDGLDRVDPEQRKLMATLGASRWQAFRFAEAPAALPAAISGARVAVAVGSIAAVFAEYTGASEGLGHLVQQSIPQLETARAWAATVLLALMSVTCFALLGLAERRLAPWGASHRKDPRR